eukprot:363988-Chlamydomonas_euryale.AAC.1
MWRPLAVRPMLLDTVSRCCSTQLARLMLSLPFCPQDGIAANWLLLKLARLSAPESTPDQGVLL